MGHYVYCEEFEEDDDKGYICWKYGRGFNCDNCENARKGNRNDKSKKEDKSTN